MAAYFFASSALVKRYAKETGTGWMLGLFRRATRHGSYAARITRVKVTSALTRKNRGGHLTSDALTRALARLRRDFLQTRIFTVEITPAVLQNAKSRPYNSINSFTYFGAGEPNESI